MKVELAATTKMLLREIRNRKMYRRDVAKTYALALLSSEETDWPRVNRAIIKRWSFSAMVWIKRQAWSGKCYAHVGGTPPLAVEAKA